MEHLPGIGPLEGVGHFAIPVVGETPDRSSKLSDAGEGATPEAFARQDAEPDFDLIEPAAVEGREDEGHAWVGSEPRLRVGPLPRVDVVSDDHDPSSAVRGPDAVEEGDHPRDLPVGGDLDDHVAGADVEGREDVARPVALVLELDTSNSSRGHRDRGVLPRASLDTRLLVHAEQDRPRRRIEVELADRGCLLVEVRVRRVEPVLDAVGFESHRPQEAAEGRAADLPAEPLPKEQRQLSKAPPREFEAELRGRLDHQRGDLLPYLRLDHRAPASTRPILQRMHAALNESPAPSTDHLPVQGEQNTDGLDAHELRGHQDHLGADHEPVARRPSLYDCQQPFPLLALERNAVLRYGPLHPLLVCVGSQLANRRSHMRGEWTNFSPTAILM